MRMRDCANALTSHIREVAATRDSAKLRRKSGKRRLGSEPTRGIFFLIFGKHFPITDTSVGNTEHYEAHLPDPESSNRIKLRSKVERFPMISISREIISADRAFAITG